MRRRGRRGRRLRRKVSRERSEAKRPFEHPAGGHYVDLCTSHVRSKRKRRIMAENVVFVCGFLADVTLF